MIQCNNITNKSANGTHYIIVIIENFKWKISIDTYLIKIKAL